MAIICRSYNLLFIMAPRTACTAIGDLLVRELGGEYLPEADTLDERGYITVARKHTTLHELISSGYLQPDDRTRLCTFACVRNPFDSLVSMYVKKSSRYQPLLDDPSSWVYRIRGYVDDIRYCRDHSFEDWVIKRYWPSLPDRLLGRRRRSLLRKYTDGVDVRMRFERLQDDFDQVLRRVGAPPLVIPSLNQTPQRELDYRRYYTPLAQRAVEYTFKDDLRQYGYTF